MKNTGLDYEILTKKVFETILRQDSVTNLVVQHDVVLQGRILSHQIDVLWAFDAGGVRYTTIVQAKDWRFPVNQGELLKFGQVLDDLPGQPRGIFVTRTGYQEGAREFAQAKGIILYELAPSAPGPFIDGTKPLVLRMNCFRPLARNVTFDFDKEWIKKEKRRLGIPAPDKFKCGIIQNAKGEVPLYDEDGREVCTWTHILNQMHDYSFAESPPRECKHDFTAPTYVKTDLSGFSRVRVTTLRALIEVVRKSETLTFSPDDFVSYALKNVLEGTSRRFNKNIEEL